MEDRRSFGIAGAGGNEGHHAGISSVPGGELEVSASEPLDFLLRRRSRGGAPLSSPGRLALLWALAIALCCAGPRGALAGGEARYFRTESQRDFLAGTLSGIAVDPAGSLSLADRVERVSDLGEPFLFAMAEHPDGWVVGTGNDGRVILVRRDGTLEMLFSAPEPQVFAVWTDADGTVLAGSSPNGKVYRLSADGADVVFDPGEIYIWALARDSAGNLLVATGTDGRLYRVDRSGRGEILYDSDDTHIRSLLPLKDRVLIGTAGEGLVLSLADDGTARTLYDASEPEVVALARGVDGSVHAALLASEASHVDLAASRGQARTDDDADQQAESKESVVTVSSEESPAFAGSRPADFKGARSVVVRISASGLIETLWKFENETVYALHWHDDRLWVGTGLDGKLYSLQDGKMVLEKDVDERQIVALADGRPGPAFATTNAAAVFEVTADGESSGTFTSAALDAGQVARFGTLHWQGEVPDGSEIGFAARSGLSSEPDRTWSDWIGAASGREVALSDVPPGRFLQWRAELRASGTARPRISEVTVSYVQENLSPRISEFAALDPGVIYVPANFNPGNQVFEPANPTRAGIFTTLRASDAEAGGRKKKLWKKGFQTLVWQAEDPNEDELEYSLHFRPDDGSLEWLPMEDGIEDTHYSFDAAALPDGRYRFLLRAADRDSESRAGRLVAEQVSESVVIDSSVPVLESVAARPGELEVTVSDASSPIRTARVSVDAGEWRPVEAVDGLLDGRRETLSVPRPSEASLLLLQVMDASFNTVTFDLTENL
jgi:hypothetical protein